MGLWETFLNWLRSLFFKQEMELSLIGLQNAGKTSLVNVIATGGYSEDMIPTVGFNMRKIIKGNVTIKLWDLGGQPRFRSMWERYCRAVSAIVYVIDKPEALTKQDLTDQMELGSITDREVCCFMISRSVSDSGLFISPFSSAKTKVLWPSVIVGADADGFSLVTKKLKV
ncbi:hypothetical protein F0562_020779 [Nyssa sinensis]|uniref:ADP-ribosylation factor-like protein 8A n=1 Tax=Nyssa sinensis TaxID=561372 RepID=A0A5J5BUL2_9ASTE|nr:hypothetical protein F0562_020779 [Nyssa sinensis]